MIMIIDTHCHLNTEEFETDLEIVVRNALDQDVNYMICIGMYEKANLKAIELAHAYNEIYATVGIHPSYVDEGYDETEITALARKDKVVAIGEIGIDLYWVKDNLSKQVEIFKKQLDLSLKLDLPVVIHMRDSAKEIYEVLKTYKGLKGVMHCFSADLEYAKKFIELGFYIGIGGPVTYKNGQMIKSVVKDIGLEHMIVETDSPYLSPVPHRGKRNEPAYTSLVVQKIAEIKGEDVDMVKAFTTNNAIKLFRLEGVKP
jgi:TatD DNase family protein